VVFVVKDNDDDGFVVLRCVAFHSTSIVCKTRESQCKNTNRIEWGRKMAAMDISSFFPDCINESEKGTSLAQPWLCLPLQCVAFACLWYRAAFISFHFASANLP
jgi:hypothetical protein